MVCALPFNSQATWIAFGSTPQAAPGQFALTFLSCPTKHRRQGFQPRRLAFFACVCVAPVRNFTVARRVVGYLGHTYRRKAGTTRNGIIPSTTLASAKTSSAL